MYLSISIIILHLTKISEDALSVAATKSETSKKLIPLESGVSRLALHLYKYHAMD
jgi:hypothetical protein